MRARPTDDSLVVAYADNLAFSATAVPLADSGAALNRDISAEVLNNDSQSSTDAQVFHPAVLVVPLGSVVAMIL